ncbi:proteasome activator pa28 REG alpha/beta subunit [Lactarius hengduanensis]|nr:proteasome activator pa28 REG alpha/beta subunit [Lactarius hengduanensis]
MRQREPQLDTESVAKSRELQNFIKSTSSPSSPFHQSHATEFTDLKVYPSPSPSNSAGESDKKKRKREVEETNSHVSSDTQHARFPNVFHANRHIASVHETLKKECEQLIELTDKVKLWINLTMPKIEDGDNFGVLIRSFTNVFSHIRFTKAYKSKKLALKEHDDKQLYIARQNLSDLRNVYAVVTDMLHKNITKLRSPKGNNGVNLY